MKLEPLNDKKKEATTTYKLTKSSDEITLKNVSFDELLYQPITSLSDKNIKNQISLF